MTVLDPEIQLVTVKGRTYRIHAVTPNEAAKPSEDDSGFWEDDDEPVCDGDSVADDENVVSEGDGFATRWHVEPVLYKFLIGAKGQTKKQLEAETKTRISVPSQTSRDTQVPHISYGGVPAKVLRGHALSKAKRGFW